MTSEIDDDDDLRSLSERILPITSISDTNQTTSRTNPDRNRFSKPQKSSSVDNQISHEHTSSPTTASTGDIIHMSDGTRKKYNGSSWRRMCSKPNCSYYTQSQGLCKPHLAALKKRQHSKTDQDMPIIDQAFSEQVEPKKGDIITLSNGIRKKYDGRQYRRVCANVDCTIVVHGSLEYQNGFCPHHYHEYRAKTIAQTSTSEPEPEPTPPSSKSVISSSHKRRRPNTPSQTSDPSNKSSTPKSNRRLSIAVIPASVNIEHPNKGDVIEMENGSRKKFDGAVWRTICSIPGCLIAAQRSELCRKHFVKLNGRPTTAPTMAMSGIDPWMEEEMVSDVKEESTDYDDHLSNTSDTSDAVKHERSFPDPEENLDHSVINALSASREKFPTIHLKKWLREHRINPYPTHEEKIQLAKQSSITYDQVTTWFNNARAILRRRQTNFRHSFDAIDDDSSDHERSFNEHRKSIQNHRSLPIFNGVYCRSIGVQCSPSTADQGTEISTMTDEELTSDRRIKILTPSSRLFTRNSNQVNLSNSPEVPFNGIEKEKIILTSTCLDDDQMNRVKEFCSRFEIESSNVVDKHTTHLITDEEEGETLVCPLSKKVIQAVARHMYVVTYRWIVACLEANRILNEKLFEIQGDLTLSSDHHGMQRSRQSLLADNFPSNFLLENFSIMLKCNGCQEMMNNEELIELVQLSGAKHTTDSHFSRLQTGIQRIVLCEKEYLINRREMYDKCLHAGIHFLTPEWFLESLVQYRIQPYQEYQISP